ncbi:glycosyltransferase [uncultured Stenotrophomonas sp.]|uniref:glycosyltransferase family protein n=1 Tax=uncultured Stenotrophomonas sp. TaxID=165438 RepID=UPI0025E17F98|nr:glycosyltransferase [uncultured Stenotrophomonas sp.]
MHNEHGDASHGGDEWADRINEAYYDGMGKRFGEKTRARINWMCAQVRGKTVLDVGCSQGITSLLVAREGMRVTGLDIYQGAIDYANAERAKEIDSVRQRLDFRCASLASFDGGVYDTVILGEVVEHQTNPTRFIQQARGFVAAGGRIVITVPYGLNPWPDHKASIFPRDLYAALFEEFEIQILEVIDGYIRVVADRGSAHDQHEEMTGVLLAATEKGALVAQADYYSASSSFQEAAKEKVKLEAALQAAQTELSSLEIRRAELERDISARAEQNSVLQRMLVETQQAFNAAGADISASMRGLRQDLGESRAEQLQLNDKHALHVAALNRYIASLERDLLAVREAESAARHASQVLQEQCAALIESSKQVDGNSHLAERERADFRRSESAAKIRLAALEGELAVVRDAKSETAARLKSLQREFFALRDKSGAQARELESANKGAEGLRKTLDELARQMRATNEQLADAQEKRSGHWAKYEYERERNASLIEFAGRLHDENQRYQQSVALAVGRAVMGLTSGRGLLRFPRAMADVLRSYRSRINGEVAIAPMALPKGPKPKLTPKVAKAQFVELKEGVARKEAASRTECRKTELSIIGWEQEMRPGMIPVATVLDEFSRACFAPHMDLVEVRPDNWSGLCEKLAPRFLFVESAWRGNMGTWRYRIAADENPPGREFGQMIDGFRSKGIPTVFWNKEDPVHFDAFVDAACSCDFIFTTAAESVQNYRQKSTARVEVMQFAAEDSLHNPMGSSRRNGRVCFAGSFYAEDFERRREAQVELLDAASAFQLDIYDRNFGGSASDTKFRFPEKFAGRIRGKLGFDELCGKYREYQVFLNVNSVDDSKTMFSRRVFELLACGTPVVSTYSEGIEETFGNDIVWQVRNGKEATEALRILLSDPIEWRRRSLAGIRAVHSSHTYRHRFAKMVSMIEGRSPSPQLIIAISEVADKAQLESALFTFLRQDLAADMQKQLVLVCRSGFRPERTPVGARIIESTDATLGRLIERERASAPEAVVAVLSPRAVYGRHYLLDALIALRYSGAALVGKSRNGAEYEWDSEIDPNSLVVGVGAPGALGKNVDRWFNLDGSLVGELAAKVYVADSMNFATIANMDDRDLLLQNVEI